MAQKLIDIDGLQSYLQGVMTRADHHANRVHEVALAIAGAIIWAKDKDPLSARTYKGQTANILGFSIKGQKYVAMYDHQNESIVIKRDSHLGQEVASFNNSSNTRDVKREFEKLL